MKGLRAALVSTGIGALVVLLGMLVNWLMKAFEASSKADKEFEEQQILIQKQINEEQSKKKTDHGKIAKWENQIREIAQEMAAIINEMLENISFLGTRQCVF